MKTALIAGCCALCLLASAGCQREAKKQTAAVAQAWAITANDPVVAYVEGFFDEEGSGDGQTWRWMQPKGFIGLKNLRRDAVLTLRGNCPAGALQGAATVKITLNDQTLEQFSCAENFTKTYSIPAAQQGRWPYSDLIITADRSFVPREVDSKIQDDRRLALQLLHLTWE